MDMGGIQMSDTRKSSRGPGGGAATAMQERPLQLIPDVVDLTSTGLIAGGQQRATTAAVRRAASTHLTPRRLRRNLVAADVVTIMISLAVAFGVWNLLRSVPSRVLVGHLVLAAISIPIWIVALAANKLYIARAVERASEEFRRLWTACGFGLIVTVALAFAVQYRALSRLWIVIAFASVGVALTLERHIARRTFQRLRSTGRISRKVAIIGTDAHAIDLMNTLQHSPSLGYSVVGLVGDPAAAGGRSGAVLGTVDESERILTEHGCVGAIVSLSSTLAHDVNHLTRQLTDRGFHIALSSSLRDINVGRIRPQAVDGQTMLYVEPTIRDGWRAIAKRAFDITVATLGLVVMSPVLAVTAVLIKLESPGPVFFRQERVGLNGTTFEIMKLRTMSNDAEQQRDELLDQNESDGPLFKIKEDPRITRVGRVLRAWSIDELPQFFNVLRGDMSVVGPRPALPDEVAQWDDDVRQRLRVLPGITGLWQVAGRSSTTFDVYKRLDLYYVANWSLWHDAHIVGKTFSAVLLRRGAS